jgi:hypothetical protein
VVMSVVAAAVLCIGASVAALTNDRLLFVAGVDGVQLILFSAVIVCLGLGVFVLSRAVENAHAYEPRDDGTIVLAGVMILAAWFTVGVPLFLVMALTSTTTYTRLLEVPGHKSVVVAASGWDELSLRIYQGDGIILDALSTPMPTFDSIRNPITSGNYTLTDHDGSLVLSFPVWPGSEYTDHQTVVVK